MDELIVLQNNIMNLKNNDDGLLDMYFQITLNFDLHKMTNKLSEKEKNIFLTRCGLTFEEINFYNEFDYSNYENTINYIIKLSEYDSIKSKVFKVLFSTLRCKHISYFLE